MKYITKSDGDICPTNCPCCADELVVLKVWGEWNYYLCESCKAIYDYKGNTERRRYQTNIIQIINFKYIIMAIIVLIALLLVVAFSINKMLKKRKGNKGEMDSAE